MSIRITSALAAFMFLTPFAADAAEPENLLGRRECGMHGTLHEPVCRQSFLTLASGTARLDGHLISITGHLVKIVGEFLLFQDPVAYRYSGGIGAIRIKPGEAKQVLDALVSPEEPSSLLLGREACNPVTIHGRYTATYEDELWSMGTVEMVGQFPDTRLFPEGMSVEIRSVDQVDLKRMCAGRN